MTSGGSLAGPQSVVHDTMSKPGRVSAIIGISGATAVRLAEVTASARELDQLGHRLGRYLEANPSVEHRWIVAVRWKLLRFGASSNLR